MHVFDLSCDWPKMNLCFYGTNPEFLATVYLPDASHRFSKPRIITNLIIMQAFKPVHH